MDNGRSCLLILHYRISQSSFTAQLDRALLQYRRGQEFKSCRILKVFFLSIRLLFCNCLYCVLNRNDYYVSLFIPRYKLSLPIEAGLLGVQIVATIKEVYCNNWIFLNKTIEVRLQVVKNT